MNPREKIRQVDYVALAGIAIVQLVHTRKYKKSAEVQYLVQNIVRYRTVPTHRGVLMYVCLRSCVFLVLLLR